jgi:hypothetical protein
MDELEPLRQRGQIPAASVVVLVEVEFSEGLRPDWTTRPETVCGAVGCYTTNRTYFYDVPTVQAELTLTVYDGPSARVLQRMRVEAAREGRRFTALKARLTRELVGRVLRLVEARRVAVRVELLRVEALPAVDRAIAFVEAGEWQRGRAVLERAVDSAQMEQLPAKARARVYYDLAMARRFDPQAVGDAQRHFRSAAAPLRKAIELDPQARYARALRALRAHREQLQALEEQREAADYNFRLGEAEGSVPPPPPGYED